MKRSKLYELVWSKPMTKLGAELGISDVGLAKACRRHAIPVPPRGHWAKLQAGKASPKLPLPQSEMDIEVSFTTVPPAQRQADVARQREAKAVVAEKTVALRAAAPARHEVDQRPHPLVRATLDYCSRLPARAKRWERMSPHQRLYADGEWLPPNESGRWILNVPDGLMLTASDESLSWALGFLDRIFKGLAVVDVKVVRQAGKDREPASIDCVLGQECLKLSFREGYRRVKLTAAEFAQAKAKESWAREWVYLPSGTFTLTFQGTEHSVSKAWSGTQEKLSALEDEIVATCLLLLEAQPRRREERLAQEHRRRVEAERAERQRRIAQARREQLDRAFKAAEAYEKVDRLRRFLAVVESEMDHYNAPYDERARVWLRVVREELDNSNPYLEIISESLTVPSWASWPPDWWPASMEEDADAQENALGSKG
jgi:hypothetical protein